VDDFVITTEETWEGTKKDEAKPEDLFDYYECPLRWEELYHVFNRLIYLKHHKKRLIIFLLVEV